MARRRLKWLGVAFASKYLFFCGGPEAAPALVLDSMVQRWMREHAGWQIRPDWNVADYRDYVRVAVERGTQLQIPAARVEYPMFVDAVTKNPQNHWADSTFALDDAAVHRRLPAEDCAVLEALDEAAEAFTAPTRGR